MWQGLTCGSHQYSTCEIGETLPSARVIQAPRASVSSLPYLPSSWQACLKASRDPGTSTVPSDRCLRTAEAFAAWHTQLAVDNRASEIRTWL